MTNVIKNVAESTLKETEIEKGFVILKLDNKTKNVQCIIRKIDSSFIQFHFCIKGAAKFNFNQGKYGFDVSGEQSLLLYNRQQDLPINLELQPDCKMISVLISIKIFHSLFSQEANFIHFLSDENKEKKYYDNRPISPAKMVILNQIAGHSMHTSIEKLYLKAKSYELLSLYFNRTEDADIEQCPFLVDEQNVIKIRKAKDIIIDRMAEPPSLQELANEVELTLKKLKEGFKQIYGDSVYSFLFDYKMEVARKLLESNQHNVNEVGHKVGYSTSSHFIAAFKKKFGTTPKKYIQSTILN